MIKLLWITFITLVSISSTYGKTSESSQPIKTQPKEFCSTQILAHKIKGGHSWTLTTRLGKFLQKAEKEYGVRDKSWTILGVEFSAEGQPTVWYPFSHDNTKFIAIQLTRRAANNKKRALFQLAHETIHLLSPAGPNQQSSVLEEGLATYFSIHALADTGVKIKAQYIGSKPYAQSYILVSKLYELHSDTSTRIKGLRAKGRTLSNINKDELMQSFPNIDAKLAGLLTQRFDTLK